MTILYVWQTVKCKCKFADKECFQIIKGKQMSIGIDCLREFSFVLDFFFFFGGQPGHNYPTFRVPDRALGGHLPSDHHQLRAR